MIYFVATPIGNLKDISYRAVQTLESVDVIACEDTRHSLGLLNAYGIKKQLIAYHKFNERSAAEKLIELAESGKSIAVISDAGTPVISDPGNVLTELLTERGIEFTVIPGANAFVPALILSGFDASRFAFIGFLPEKQKDRRKLLDKYKGLDMTLIFYCAPHDVVKTVEWLHDSLGNRRACSVREITKLHETVEHFSLADGYTSEPRGEYVIIVEGATEQDPAEGLTPEEHLKKYLDAGMDKKQAVKLVAKERGINKNEIYKLTVDD